MKILFDDRWIGPHGIGRFASEFLKRTSNIERISPSIIKKPSNPFDPVHLSWKISNSTADIFYSPGYNPPLYSKTPFVFTLHDLNHIDVPESKTLLKTQYYEKIIKPAAKKAHAIITISEFSRQRILDWINIPKTKVINASCGVDEHFTTDGAIFKPGYEYLFYIGNRKPHKNLKRLLKAFSISSSHKDFKLIISGYECRQTSLWIKDFSLQNKVFYSGYILDKDLPSYYRGAVATMFPSLYEGFGLPSIESMACGTPVLTSNLGALKEAAGPNTILVDPLRVESIAEGINQIITKFTCTNYSKKPMTTHAKQFSWDKVHRKITTALNNN